MHAECNFEAGKVYSYESLVNCLKDYPIVPSSEEGKMYISTIKEYLESYAFRDIMLNPPSPLDYQAYDVLADLKALEDNLPQSGFEFSESLVKIIRKLRDGHTAFQRPCLTALTDQEADPFYMALPVNFELEVEPDQSGESIVRTFITNVISPALSEELSNTYAPLMGAEVLGISFDNAAIDSTIPAWESLSAYADDALLCRTPGANLNALLTSSFFVSSLSSAPLPPAPAIKIRYINTTTEEIEETSVVWVVMAMKDVLGFEDLCPLRDQANSHQNFRLASSTKRSKKSLEAHSGNTTARLRAALPLATIAKKKGAKPQKLAEEEQNEDLRRIIRREEIRREIAQTMLASSKPNTHNNGGDLTDIGFLTFHDDGNLFSGVFVDEGIGLLTIPTFTVQTESAPTWCEHIIDSLIKMKKAGASSLILDFYRNPGGSVMLEEALIRVLYPDLHPLHPALNVPLTLSTTLETSGIQATDYQDYTVTVDLLDNTKKITETGLGTSRTREWSQTFAMYFSGYGPFEDYLKDTEYYHKRFFEPSQIIAFTDGSCASACAIGLKHISQVHGAKIIGRGARWTRNATVPHDVGFVAGGFVSSSTSIQQKISLWLDNVLEMKENNPEQFAAMVEGMGLDPDSDTIESDLLTLFPAEFPRLGASLSFTVGVGYSFLPETQDQPVEFLLVPPDDLLHVYPYPSETYNSLDHIAIVKSLSKYLPRCFSWDVQEDGECLKQAQQNATKTGTALPAHVVYGHPCDEKTQTYDITKCVRKGCATGYYLALNGSCTPNPLEWVKPLADDDGNESEAGSGSSSSNWKTAGIVFIVLFIIAVIVIVVLVIVCIICIKRNSSGDSNSA